MYTYSITEIITILQYQGLFSPSLSRDNEEGDGDFNSGYGDVDPNFEYNVQ